jgi:hypothetical protein
MVGRKRRAMRKNREKQDRKGSGVMVRMNLGRTGDR